MYNDEAMRVESGVTTSPSGVSPWAVSAAPGAGGTLKITVCLLLAVLLAGCVPIGFRAQNLPYAAIVVSQ